MMVSIVRPVEDADGRATARRLLRELVEGGWMVPGDLVGSGFQAWDMPPAEAVRRLLADLDAHDWDVMNHVLIWFENTPAGDERARKLTG
jgi:hypothetical protein